MPRYVPLGLKRWFTSADVKTVVELDWWESARHPGTKIDITFAPAQVNLPRLWPDAAAERPCDLLLSGPRS
jgi:hypothetical protein